MAQDRSAMVASTEPDIGLLRELLASSPQVIYVYDQIGHRFEYLSENLTAVTGYTADSLNDPGASVLTFVHPDDMEKVRVHVGDLFRSAGGEAVSVTFRFRHAKGRWIWVKAVDRVLDRDTDGRVHRTVGHAHEVTEMLEAQQALELSNRANAFLLNSSRILADFDTGHEVTLQRLAEYAAMHFNAVCDISVVSDTDGIVRPLAMYHPNGLVRASVRKAFTLHTVKVGEGMVGRVIATGREAVELSAPPALRVRVAEYDPLLVPESYIYCPMRSGRRVFGTLHMTRLEGSGTFSEHDLDQVRKLTEHTSLFLDNFQLRESQERELQFRAKAQRDLENANRVGNFLLRVSRLLSDVQSDRNSVLLELTEAVASHFNVFCVVYLSGAEGEELQPRAFFHSDTAVREALKRVFESDSLENGLRTADFVCRMGTPYIIRDASGMDNSSTRMEPLLVPRAVGFWPLMGRESIGSICLCRLHGEEPFTELELEHAAQLSRHLSLFLENMLLHDRQELEIGRRNEAEQQLSRNEADLRTILNAIPINISRVSKDLRYRFLNAAYLRMGIIPEEMLGRHIIDLLGEEGMTRIMPRIERVLKGEMLHYDEELVLTNGARRNFNVVIAPDYDNRGNVQGFYSCTLDTTDKMEAERELRISEERYRSLLLHSGDAFCLHRFSGEILDVNSFATTLLGYSREELLTMNINVIDRGWLTPDYPRWLAKVEADTPVTFETDIYHRDGHAIPVEVRFVKRIEDGEVLIQALVRDRTEKRQQEERLRQSEERQRILIENVDDVILTVDFEGTILSINNPKQGNSAEDIEGTSIFSTMTSEEGAKAKEGLRLAREEGRSFEVLSRYTGPDGTTEWYLTNYCPVQEGDFLVAVSRNITHMKESELQVMNGMTLGQEQERKRLGAELHDGVGQILTSIAIELSQLRDSPTCVGEAHDLMGELGERVTEAITEVRNISHDLMPGLLEGFGLADAVREVCRNMRSRTGISISFDGVDLRPIYSGPVETHLYRIAQELITNCVRHAHCSRIHVNLIDHGDMLSLSVEDDGIGFDTGMNHRGIGLRNVHSRASILGGHLTVESSGTSGTLVIVETPIYSEDGEDKDPGGG